MSPFPSNRKNPFSRMCIRAYFMQAEPAGLSIEDIASIAGVTKVHVYNVTKPIKGLHGASPSQVADAIYQLYTAELGAEVGRELWDPWWASAQQMAAEGIALFKKAISDIEKSSELLIVYGRGRRKAIREAFATAHANLGTGSDGEAA